MAAPTSISPSGSPLKLFHRHSFPEASVFLDHHSFIRPLLFRPTPSQSRNLRPTFRSHKLPKDLVIPSPVSPRMRVACAASAGDRNRPSSEPLWVTFPRGVRNLVLFLLDQPRQLRHIEWPSFQDTLKTSVLTLVLVAMLITALSSLDALLSFLLAALSRKAG